jgi:hypothetical protein
MCHFITATLPEGTDLAALCPVLKEHGGVLNPLENPWVQEQLPSGTLYLNATSGICACGTSLGSLRRTADRPAASKKELRKLRQEGWSEAKIERWVEEKEAAKAQALTTAQAARTADAERWITQLRSILAAGKTDRVGLLLHWYRGSLEDERIHLRNRVPVRIDEVTPDLLMNLEEDVLYEFQR